MKLEAESLEIQESGADGPADDGSLGEEARGFVIEWFRLERGRQLSRILLVGAPLVLLGDVCAGVALSFDWLGGAWQTAILALGIAATAAGPGYVIWKLRDLWGEDHFIALRTRGVQYVAAEENWFESWDDVSEIDLDEAGEVRLELKSGATKRVHGPFAGATSTDLAGKLRTVRRKALFGLYRT